MKRPEVVYCGVRGIDILKRLSHSLSRSQGTTLYQIIFEEIVKANNTAERGAGCVVKAVYLSLKEMYSGRRYTD